MGDLAVTAPGQTITAESVRQLLRKERHVGAFALRAENAAVPLDLGRTLEEMRERQQSLSMNREPTEEMNSPGWQTQEKITRFLRQTSISEIAARSWERRSWLRLSALAK